MTYHVCNEEMLNVDQIIRIPMDDGRWMESGIWSLLGLTRSIEKSISIVKMRKEWKGCGWGTSADGRPVAAWWEAHRVHFGFMQGKNWLCEAASHVEMMATRVKEAHRKGKMRAPKSIAASNTRLEALSAIVARQTPVISLSTSHARCSRHSEPTKLILVYASWGWHHWR
jgi:hypothetical protein